jgi:hypothetical protein
METNHMEATNDHTTIIIEEDIATIEVPTIEDTIITITEEAITEDITTMDIEETTGTTTIEVVTLLHTTTTQKQMKSEHLEITDARVVKTYIRFPHSAQTQAKWS